MLYVTSEHPPKSNNSNAADGQKPLVGLLRLTIVADLSRWCYPVYKLNISNYAQLDRILLKTQIQR
jgi:hypothetical protein